MWMLLALALAAEPDWAQRFSVGPTLGPPAEKCESKAKVVPPGGPDPERKGGAGADAPETPPPEHLRINLAPNADNRHLAPEVLARLSPPDLASLPVEPLRGREEDLAALRARVSTAAVLTRPLRVGFWGASHVAGEFFTGEVRRLLQDRHGDAGHGFVMPAPPWDGYRASDINLCAGGAWASDFDQRRNGRRDGLYGPAGMSVESNDPLAFGWVETTRENPHGRSVSKFEVMFYKQPAGGTLLAQVDEQPPIEILTAGEGPGVALIRVADGPHRLRIAPKGDGPVRIFGVNLERDGQGVVVDAMGVSGKTASSWMRWDSDLMAGYLARRQVDIVVMAYGTNEANDRSMTDDAYRASLRRSLTRMRELLSDAECVLIGPSDRGKKVKGTLFQIWAPTSTIAAVQREIGPEFGCVTWDLQAATGGPGSVFGWRAADPTLMAQDLIHFSAAGYRELGRRFVGQLFGG